MIVDSAAGLPASHVISDVKKTSDEYGEEKHEERVDELSREYEEFLRSREAGEADQESEGRSVVIIQDPDRND